MANHVPLRVCPWNSAWASIVRPSTADAVAANGSRPASTTSAARAICARRRPWRVEGRWSGAVARTQAPGTRDDAEDLLIDVPPPRKVAPDPDPGRAPGPGRSVAIRARLSYDAPGRRSSVEPPGSDRPWSRHPPQMASRDVPQRPRRPVPEIRPFRALRYHPDVVADPGRVVAPPYDVIDPERHARLLARDPRNAVRLDLPTVEAGDEPDDRYRRAARTLAAWRSDGTLRKDPRA